LKVAHSLLASESLLRAEHPHFYEKKGNIFLTQVKYWVEPRPTPWIGLRGGAKDESASPDTAQEEFRDFSASSIDTAGVYLPLSGPPVDVRTHREA